MYLVYKVLTPSYGARKYVVMNPKVILFRLKYARVFSHVSITFTNVKLSFRGIESGVDSLIHEIVVAFLLSC